jgi:NADH:ubiquinone oxidoreductase subunit E
LPTQFKTRINKFAVSSRFLAPMDTRIELILCLGSSCFSRGNKKILSLVQEYIRKNELENRVNFHGNRCFDACAKGPVMKIGEKIYYSVSEESLEDILDEAFGIKENKF